MILPAEPRHIMPIVAGMRELDYQEIEAASNIEPHEALHKALRTEGALTWTLAADGVAVAMGGIGPSESLPNWAVVWLVGTDWIDRHPMSFTKLMKEKLEGLLEIYTGLYNWVDTRNVPARDWLDSIGFYVMDASPFGANHMDFHYFWIRSDPEEDS
jgi:hypothetical protein